MPTKLFMLCSLIFSTCQGLQFNVSRVTKVSNSGSIDLFTNLDPSAKCPNEKPNLDAGKPWCTGRKAYCSSQGCCVCECQYSDATFQLKMNPYNASCVGNKDIRTFAGCSKLLESETLAHPLTALDPSASGFKGILNLPNKCKVKSVEYLDMTWKSLAKKDADTFSISSIGNWPYTALLWNGRLNSAYFGYIMRVNVECSKGNNKQTYCVLFKTRGTLSVTIPDLSTQKPPVTKGQSTTVKHPTKIITKKAATTTTTTTTTTAATTTAATTTAATTTAATTTAVTTTAATTTAAGTTVTTTTKAKTIATTKATARRSTHMASAVTVKSTTNDVDLTTKRTSTSANAETSPTKVPTFKAKTTENTKSTIITAENTSTTESQVLTDHPFETLPTESTARDFATLEPTHHSSRNKEPENNENKFSAQKQDKLEDMTIFIVIGVAAVICISVGLLCTWLIISQRRKHRNAESYGAGTTVIANPTNGAQNHFPMTGFFKNPVCDDAVYMEPEALVRKSSVSLIGNPSYENCEDLLINNPGAKNSQQILLNNATKKSLNTSSRNIIPTKENSYDCAHVRSHNNGKPDQDKPVYQSLVEADVEANCTSDPNLNTYQSLNPDGLIYQPLIKSVVQERQYEVPEYLALLNPGETPGKNLPSPPEYQPPYTTGPPPADLEESPEYADYADLDELEKISANEASNKSLNGEQCYLTPLHNVPEGPNYDYANASVYDVLEGPDPHIYGSVNLGFEPPAYEVPERPDFN